MNRKTLIVVALSFLMLSTVSTAATAQKGKSPVYQFAVTGEGGGSGKLMINLDEQKFVFNGKGFEPGKPYQLWYEKGRTDDLPEPIYPFDAALANAAGTVHIEGAWTEALGSWVAPAFTIKSIVTPGTEPGSGAVYTGLITGDGTEAGWGHYYVFETDDGTHRIYQGLTGPASLPAESQATFTVEAIRMNADYTIVVASGPVVVTSTDPPGTWSWYADMKPA